MTHRIQQPRVSVVIPTYNRARDLRRALETLRAQTMNAFEVIVCDDGSTDDTATVARAFEPHLDIVYDYAANWGGPARPRNRGISRARAPYIAFLDSDDWWTPRKLTESVAALDGGADVVYHDLYLVTHPNQRRFYRRVRSRQLKAPVFDDLIMEGNALPASSVVIRRSVLDAIGGMPEDQDLVAMEDFACWLNAARITDRFTRIPMTLGYYWSAGGNISNDLRTIALLDIFEARYASALRDGLASSWLAYSRGVAFAHVGDYARARRHLARVRAREASASLFLKSVWRRLAVTVAHGYPRDH